MLLGQLSSQARDVTWWDGLYTISPPQPPLVLFGPQPSHLLAAVTPGEG
jgi:hypothetical protein